MLMVGARRALIALTTLGLISGGTVAYAQTGNATAAFADGLQAAKKKKKKVKKENAKPKIQISTQKGVAKGLFSVADGKSRSASKSPSWGGATTSKKRISEKERHKALLQCFLATNDLNCLDDPTPQNPTTLTGTVARAMAINLVASLRFPAPKPIFGPDPNNNEWKMLAVGFPVWLWTEGPTTVSTSSSSSGFTFRMTARWRSTTFDMGDGNTVTCTSMAKYSRAVKPGTPSPTCGHVYTQPSLPKGKYQVRAVADWDVSWSVAGFSGVIPAYNEASASIPVGELSALNR